MLKRAEKLINSKGYSNIHLANSKAQNLKFNDEKFDLVITSNVLLHIPPESIKEAISELVRVSKNYILCIEYFEKNKSKKSEHCFLHDYQSLFLDEGVILKKCEKVTFEKQNLFL